MTQYQDASRAARDAKPVGLCVHCGKEYARNRAKQRFCCAPHKDAWHAEQRRIAMKKMRGSP
jgi:hypothetical protein